MDGLFFWYVFGTRKGDTSLQTGVKSFLWTVFPLWESLSRLCSSIN